MEKARPSAQLVRALSKLGLASRGVAAQWIAAGRVRVNGRIVTDPARAVAIERDRIEVDGERAVPMQPVYFMVNKPRGLVTTRADEQGRGTVYACLPPDLQQWLAPVGRLDKASEGLLLFTNDTQWAARLLAPTSHVLKVYHVQIDRIPDAPLLATLQRGVATALGPMAAQSVRVLRQGHKNAWLEIALDEGKNRQIRRMLEAAGVSVLRLVRVAIGPIQLGALAKGAARTLDASELAAIDTMLV